MNKEERFMEELFGKAEETEAVEPRTTEIVNMSVGSVVPNLKNPYKYREEDMKPLEDSIRENGIIQPLMRLPSFFEYKKIAQSLINRALSDGAGNRN